MNVDEDAHAKKKTDKLSENLTVSLDAKKSDKGDEDSKPRIVLTFRSEKSNAKTTNMKIVSTEEKQEEAPRRSSRTRGKWEWVCDSDTSPKKDKSGGQTASENDESDSSHTTPKRSTRRRSKDSDNVLATVATPIAVEKSCEQPATTKRLSRRLIPTAKVLANEELRIGLESLNNARLGVQTDKSPEEGVKTRRSARAVVTEPKPKVQAELEVVEIATDDDSQSQNSVMKLKHLCELGLKAISPEDVDEIGNEIRDQENETEEGNETEENEIDDDDEEMEDDDPRVISKLLETDEDSDEDFECAVAMSQSNRPRRSTRLCSSYGVEDSDHSPSPALVQEEEKPTRRSSKRAGRHSHHEESERSHRSKRRRNRSSGGEEAHSEVEMEENSNPAGGDEGSEAACPADDSTIVATCFCEAPSNVHADPAELTEPVFCGAIELVDGVRVGCSHAARREAGPGGGAGAGPLLRAGPRSPYFLACAQHAAQLRNHMCCPTCGLFCSQGIFYQCSLGHLFHLECGLPNYELKLRPGCPHCGVHSYRWQPVNCECGKVKLEMKCSNKRIFLPDQREQCTPAYLGFSVRPAPGPVLPGELLPAPPVDLQRLCRRAPGAAPAKPLSPQKLCEAIEAGETAEQLIPKIVSSSGSINRGVPSRGGGTCAHAAAACGNLSALYVLQYAGANIDATDSNQRTPLMLAVLALLDKQDKDNKCKEKLKEPPQDAAEEIEADAAIESEKADNTQDKTEPKTEEDSVKDENLMKVINYLVAAGCDVNFPGPEGLTALHMAAQHGGAAACAALLAAAHAHADARDSGGWTPLVWAAENLHTDVVRVLLEAGADPLSADAEGNGVVHWCALAGAAQPLQLLLQHEPRATEALNAHTDTPLHIAARQGHYACVVILLAHGARTDVENAAGELPVEVCGGPSQSAVSLNMQMSIAARDHPPLYRLLSSDISRGREPQPVPCVNEVDDAPLPDDFTYVTRHVMPQQITVESTIESMQGCSCKDGDCSSGSCSCCALSVRGWYARGRLLASFPYHDPPMLFECNQTCGCDLRRCGNSVVTRALGGGSVLARAAQVFRAGGARGWGLRAAGRVRAGAPLAAYCGELLPPASADTRASDHYMFALDLKPDLLEQCTYKSQLCVDAAAYGSAARFVNHSCRPNLAPVRVFTHTRDLRLPTVALFATRDILPGEEFTFDYGEKFWSVKSKWMKCECGSVDCRYPEKTAEDVESS